MNRSLHLEKIKYFGFDMDYTLAGKYLPYLVNTQSVSKIKHD